MIKEISSSENKVFKNTKKLLLRSERYKTGKFIAEGARLAEDAFLSKSAEYIIVSNSYGGEIYDLPAYRISDKMFSALSDTKTTQGIIAVCTMVQSNISAISGDTLLVCDAVSDPGNLGTLIRTAECSGVSGVVLLKGTVDPYSPKVVRSAMGSLFRMPIYFSQIGEVKEKLAGYSLVTTQLDGSSDLYETVFPQKTAVVVGNEAHGISSELSGLSDLRVRIPMLGNAESLNAAVAGSVVMYEIFRQKR